jgi:hypothetical protein
MYRVIKPYKATISDRNSIAGLKVNAGKDFTAHVINKSFDEMRLNLDPGFSGFQSLIASSHLVLSGFQL